MNSTTTAAAAMDDELLALLLLLLFTSAWSWWRQRRRRRISWTDDKYTLRFSAGVAGGRNSERASERPEPVDGKAIAQSGEHRVFIPLSFSPSLLLVYCACVCVWKRKERRQRRRRRCRWSCFFCCTIKRLHNNNNRCWTGLCSNNEQRAI